MIKQFIQNALAHKLDFVFLVIAVTSSCLAVSFFLKVQEYDMAAYLDIKENLLGQEESLSKETDKDPIVVDIAGAVKNPGTYSFPDGSRLNEALEKSGGLNSKAAFQYIQRVVNLSSYLVDEGKYYFPTQKEIDDQLLTISEVNVGVQPLPSTESQKIGTQPLSGNDMPLSLDSSQDLNNGKGAGISINSASSSELEKLNGVGPVIAGKIIAGRPYADMSELKTKKIVSDSLFDKIISDISL